MRGTRQGGDVLTIGTVAGASTKKYYLAPVDGNVSYEDVSDQPEARINQPLYVPISYHGGVAYSKYDPKTAGAMISQGFYLSTPNVIRPTPALNTSGTISGSPTDAVMTFFEATVNDSGTDDGKPVLYALSMESGETNCHKISLCSPGHKNISGSGVTSTNTTLVDSGAPFTASEMIGEVVTCNSKTMTVTGNTTTTLTGSAWSGGGNPGNGNPYIINMGGFGTVIHTKTWAANPTSPQGRCAEWNDGTNTYWRVPTGDNGVIDSLTSIASEDSADTWSGGTDADARNLCVVGNQLYRTKGDRGVYTLDAGSDPETEANWSSEFKIGDTSHKISDIVEMGEAAYILKANGLYEFDGVAEADLILDYGTADNNGRGSVFWHGGIAIPAATGVWWTRSGVPESPDVNPRNDSNEPAVSTVSQLHSGRWQGLASYGAYLYGPFISPIPGSTEIQHLLYARERDSRIDPPGWGSWVWQVTSGHYSAVSKGTFHGCHVARTSEYDASTVRPCVFWSSGDKAKIEYLFLDTDGAPSRSRGNVDLYNGGVQVTSGRIDWDLPRVNKQFRVIEGMAEDMAAGHSWQFAVSIDGGSFNNVGSAITSDGFFQAFWTQDSNDTGRSILLKLTWTGTSNLTGQSGPHLRDVGIRALAIPNTANIWTFLVHAEDETMRTARGIRTGIEGYGNDLKKFELPDGDSFNGIVTSIRMVSPKERRELQVLRDEKGKALPMPRYIMAVTVREMVAA
jgi:hypothetical protein